MPGIVKAKPQQWAIHPGLTKPKWFNYWNNGLILYLAHTEGGGTTVRDLSRYRNNGTLVGTTTWGIGQYGVEVTQANNTDPTVGYIDVPDSPSMSISGGLTVECIWKHDTNAASGDFHPIARKRSGGGDGYQLLVDSSGFLSWHVDTSTLVTITYSVDISDDVYHHIVATWDGANMNLYVDGLLRAGPTAQTGTIDDTAEPTRLLGATVNSSAFDAGGTLPYLRMWDRGLIANEAATLYDDPIGMLEFNDKIFEQGRVPDAAATGNPWYYYAQQKAVA